MAADRRPQNTPTGFAARQRQLDESRPRIEVDCGTPYALVAARLIALLIPGTSVYPSWLVPGRAVWSLNGVPMLPEEHADD